MANSNILKYTTLMLGVVFLTAGSYLAIERGMEYRNAQERAQVEGLAYAQQQSQAVTDYIDAEMQSVTELGDWLARKMSTTDLDQESIWLIAEHAADRKPNVYGIAIALEPYVLPDTKLFGPYYHLSDDGTYVREDVSYEHDYTNIYDPRATWYTQVLEKKEPVWSILYGPVSKDWVIEYVVPFYRNGKFAGVVDVVHSVNTSFQQFFHQISIGQEGYVVLVTDTGKFAYHPHRTYINRQLDDVARELKDPILEKGAQRMLTEEKFSLVRPNANGQVSWTIFNTLPSTGWKTIVVIRQDVKELRNSEKIRLLLDFGLGVMLAFAGLALLIFKPYIGNNFNIWAISISLAVILFLGIAWTWSIVYNFPLENGSRAAFTNNNDVNELLKPITNSVAALSGDKPILIPTGVVIETLSFTSQNASLTGYLWQSYPLDIPAENIQPPQFSNQLRPPMWRDVYSFTKKGKRVIGWYFTVDLRQNFEIKRFPLDEITVRLKIEPANMAYNMVFVPDFDGYEYISPSNKPGILETLTPPGWNLRTAYFNYERNLYNSNFGGAVKVYKNTNPALTYNIHATRKIISPLVAYCIVIYVILVQVFGLVMIKVKSPLEILSVGAALFLVNAISHNGLRNDLAASGLIYLEYFFVLLYLTILASSLNGLANTLDLKLSILQWRENLIAKVLFWPLFLGIAFAFTFLTFYPFPVTP